ncbi:MAG: RelE/StbE family addiction module toxin [Candidatus Peregrinibacteria bacterium Greene0416_19]|nr:MAG: RelE/StbE family addiction module toxin [Candidatus Peregrinibacteria bacterium Greene0416_19]
MIIRYASAFKRRFRKLTVNQQDRVEIALRLFASDPFHPQLRNHKLKGSREGVRSLSAGYDLRILYTEKDGHALVLIIAVGKHQAVY